MVVVAVVVAVAVVAVVAVAVVAVVAVAVAVAVAAVAAVVATVSSTAKGATDAVFLDRGVLVDFLVSFSLIFYKDRIGSHLNSNLLSCCSTEKTLMSSNTGLNWSIKPNTPAYSNFVHPTQY